MDRLKNRQGLNDSNRIGTGSDRNNIKREKERQEQEHIKNRYQQIQGLGIEEDGTVPPVPLTFVHRALTH